MFQSEEDLGGWGEPGSRLKVAFRLIGTAGARGGSQS
jgi:hypothetical protein